MEITFLYHSGIVFELEQNIIVVDYFAPEELRYQLNCLIFPFMQKGKRVYVLSSHFHADHFDRSILGWKSGCQDITYIFSRDILEHKCASLEDAEYLEKGEIYDDGRLHVKAYGSTDAGVSFYLECEGWRFFHAGDLNNWHWKDESTEEEIRESEDAYLAELEQIAREVSSLDVACFPVDARQGTDYMLGAEQFVSRIQVGFFVPMHFTEGGFDSIRPFAEIARKHHTQSWNIAKTGDMLRLDSSVLRSQNV